ncbi:MAG TPA: hypothetical protein VIT24_01740, partial [Acidimicrobiales bacterium]
PCLEQGWVAVAAMGCDVDDPDELLAGAELALDRARRFGDVNLETKAMADAGLAHVQSGRLAEGMALLDEAMALACGPADNDDVVSKSVCSFFTACYFAADFGRADSWNDLLRQRGRIGPGSPPARFLASHCDSVQATLLMELGRWGDAEAVLTRSIADFESAMPMPSWHPAIALADLRIRQGRLAEAEVLLIGKDQALQALLPAARLHLERGDAELARATTRRGLRVLGDDRLRAIELLTLAVEADLALGDDATARDDCDELQRRTAEIDVPSLRARADVARARLLAASNDQQAAVGLLESALDQLDADLPWLRATLLLELAQRHDEAGDRAAAVLAAKAAATVLAPLDVTVRPEHELLLGRLASGADPAARTTRAVTLERKGRWWTVSDGSTRVRLSGTKGLYYVAELVARPGAEQHALDLVDRVVGGPGPDDLDHVDRRKLGDAGEVLDAQARAAYRRRIEELRGQADDALEAGQLDTAEAVQAELDQLVGQLAQAFGLGGRSRRAASAAERARLNVTRALRAAITKLIEVLPEAGATLDRRVRTGLYCVYQPDETDPVRWIVQS